MQETPTSIRTCSSPQHLRLSLSLRCSRLIRAVTSALPREPITSDCWCHLVQTIPGNSHSRQFLCYGYEVMRLYCDVNMPTFVAYKRNICRFAPQAAINAMNLEQQLAQYAFFSQQPSSQTHQSQQVSFSPAFNLLVPWFLRSQLFSSTTL